MEKLTDVTNHNAGAYTIIATELGPLRISICNQRVYEVAFVDGTEISPQPPSEPLLAEAAAQLNAYFDGKLTQFDLPLGAEGTNFQQQVWRALCTIEFGATASYGDIAKAIDNVKAVRAVGAANGRNPIAIVVPCHRIIGANGSLTGYNGGLHRKQWLLAHERGS